ncbi:glycosyltransferase [Streptomyces rishiriensis]|uniref:Glycosyltransferase involved in cell wall biosynthesis n=1 Tax=Streptomyces rishiriensis TaxID=68264 RepID=A0ABU0NGY1_STRRH|nr:glycosyltransferase [Streptomyces rishiriensis]MDQ0577902.1 glycosyltransferase involved in cell wall biosynthesis [Streptomyces rishiriensis]
MPLISIITPVWNGGHDYIGEAYESLFAQSMPPGWEWEWIVQEDGQTGFLPSILPDDSRVSGGTSRRGGAAMARTVALGRVRGDLVRALDADDLLPQGALSRAIDTLARHRDVAWCVSACLDLLPDGSMLPGPHDPPTGLLADGVMLAGYQAGRFPVVGTTMTAYADLVVAMGGWPAVPASEDVALLMLCEAVSQGWMIDEPGAIYRKHPQQSTAQPAHWDPAERAALDEVLLPRLSALRGLGWRWTPGLSVMNEGRDAR